MPHFTPQKLNFGTFAVGKNHLPNVVRKSLTINALIAWMLFLAMCLPTWVQAQTCTGVPVASWPIDTCAAFGHANNYSELAATFPNTGGCGTPSATNIFRNSGHHSCNPGPANGDGYAFCVGDFNNSNYFPNSSRAVRFRITYGAGNTGRLTGLTFRSTATSPSLFINANPVNNNYPTLYGLRVLKNGSEIFRQIGNPTNTSWTLESFDFSTDSAFIFIGQTTFEFELYAYAPVGNGYNKYIWDLDDFTVFGCCASICDNVTTGGQIGGNQSNCGPFDPNPISSQSLPSGGSGALQYLWVENSTPNAAGATVIPGATGPTYDPGTISQTTYYRRSARRAGCTTYDGESNWVCMEIHASPVTSCTSTDVTCNNGLNGSASVSGTGGTAPYSYIWSNGATTNSISGLSAGTYSVTVSDANNCSSTCTTTVNQPTALALSVTGTDATCFSAGDGSATANVTGGTPPYSYLWTGGVTTATITGLSIGNYSVTVTDANNCTTGATVTIGEPAQIILTSNSTDPLCNGDATGTASVTITGGQAPFTYLWSTGQTTASITGLSAGNYTVSVTDLAGCSATSSVQLTDPAPLTLGVSGTNVTCSGSGDGSANAQVSGGTAPYSYLWSNGATANIITNLSPGILSVTATDANGCTSSGTVIISEPVATLVSAVAVDVSCNGGNDGSAIATGSQGVPPYTYIWSTGGQGNVQSGLSPGTYSVTATDANGCSASTSVTVNEPTPVSVAVTSTDALCNGAGDGTATATGNGGTPPYSYFWSDGQTGATASGLNAGSYSVTTTDANGCSEVATVTIGEPTVLVVSNASTLDSCDVGTGTATASPVGGTAPYSYLWSDGQTTATASGLITGTYSVTVSDANSCSVTGSTTVGTNIPTDTCSVGPGDFRTEGQGGWGSTCSGNNPGCYRNNNFAAAFPNGLTIGCNNTLTLTTSQAVENFLPCVSVPGQLTQNYVDPLCIGTVLAGQLVTAVLNVTFDQYDPNFGASTGNLVDLVIANGPLAGMTVGDLINEANNAIGGCGSTYSFSDLNNALTMFNENFLNGVGSNGNLLCPDLCPGPRPASTIAPRAVNGVIAWPNPFESTVNIEFVVKEQGETIVEVVSPSGGQTLESMNLGVLLPGTHFFTWDGTDHKSNFVSRGLYLVTIRVNDQIESVKVIKQ